MKTVMAMRQAAVVAVMLGVSGGVRAASDQGAADRAIYGELQGINKRLDMLMDAMHLQSRSAVVTSVPAIFAVPFPIACDGDCTKAARGTCTVLGYTESLPLKAPPVPGRADGAYGNVICYGRQ